MKIVIVGASSAIAEHCARIWVQQKKLELVLIGRSLSKLKRIAADLQVRSPQADVQVFTVDFCDADAIRLLVDALIHQGPMDIVLIAHGLLMDERYCQTHLKATQHVLEVNAISPALFAEAFAIHLEKRGKGKLALIGSVAGDRGRQSNYTYGAAKGLIERFAEGMQHRFAKTEVKVILIKPGPTDTPMVEHLKAKGMKVARVEQVARQIVEAIEEGTRVAYVPKKWRVIMAVVRTLPFWVFKQMKI